MVARACTPIAVGRWKCAIERVKMIVFPSCDEFWSRGNAIIQFEKAVPVHHFGLANDPKRSTIFRPGGEAPLGKEVPARVKIGSRFEILAN